jgi:hypothetical protein
MAEVAPEGGGGVGVGTVFLRMITCARNCFCLR